VGASRWGDLSRRVKTAVVLLAVSLFCVFAGGTPFLLLVGAACIALSVEWTTLCRAGAHFHGVSAICMSVVIVTACVAAGNGGPGIGLLLLLCGTIGGVIWAGSDGRESGRNRYTYAMGFPYLGFAAVALPWLRADPTVGLANTLFVLCIVWASDAGAYLVGRLVGGPKLAPGVSVGKTWSGAIGGLMSAAFAGLSVAASVSQGFSAPHVIGLGIGLGMVSQLGDLLESALKRHFGVKDSGRIIPGHGGVLDRIDALLAVAPVAALLALTVGRGVVLWR
jgi:phosphatidate cytidylyltransferase